MWWRLGIFLVVFTAVLENGPRTVAEEVKHELPDNLEIIDPKSLGLSDSDVEKFLGNVKLLPIGGDMGNNIKTQILTVGFEGDEKLNLADFENLSTDGLPDKDKEVAQAAFQRFQDFFKNPGSSQDFDKIVADAENNKGNSVSILGTNETPAAHSSPYESETTSPRYHSQETTIPEDYHHQQYQQQQQQQQDIEDEQQQQQRTVSTIEPPPPQRSSSSPRPSDEPEFLDHTQRYNLQAQEVINLLKTSANSIQNQQQGDGRGGGELPKFGGFISPDVLNGQNFARDHQAPQQLTLQQVQHFQHQHNLHQQQIQQQQQQQQQQAYRQQNEISQQPPPSPQQQFLQAFIPAQTPANTVQNFQIPIVIKPTQSFIPPPTQQQQHDFARQQHHQHQQVAFVNTAAAQINPILPQSTQTAPVVINNNNQQQQHQIFHQPFNVQNQQQQQQPQPSSHNPHLQHHHNQQQFVQQQQPQQVIATIGPQPQQYVQQQQQQPHNIGFSQPTLTPVHSHSFQPPQQFAHNFTPNHGPPQDAPVTPRTPFEVTPSIPMIPIATVENAIHRPPVVSQHMHHQQHQVNGQNVNADQATHLDIVAEIARQQHLRIAQQPPSLPSHPQQHQTQQHQAREISQEPLKVNHLQQQQQGSSSPSSVIQQQQPQQIYRLQNPQNSVKLNSPSHVHQQILSQPLSVNHHAQHQQQPIQRPLHHQIQMLHQVQQQAVSHPQAPQHQQQPHHHNQITSQTIKPQPIQASTQQINLQTVPAQYFQRPQEQSSSSKLTAGRQQQQQQLHQQPQQLPPPPQASMSFQRPVNTIFPPPRPAAPTRLVYFPTPKVNMYFKDPASSSSGHPRFNVNVNPGGGQPGPHPQYRPHPHHHFQNSVDFRQNLIPVEGSFEKPRFPVRPDPNTFRQQQQQQQSFSSHPNRFTSYNPSSSSSSSSHNSHNPFGGSSSSSSSSSGPERDNNVREARHFNFISSSSSRGNPLTSSSDNDHHHHNGPNHSHRNNNNHQHDDLLAGGSDHSLSITKDLFKPDFIESIQPSRMVAYRYLTSAERID